MANVFSAVGNLNPRRTAFNLSEHVQYDVAAGQIVPIMFRECYPGDTFQIGVQDVVRLAPLIGPAYVGISLITRFFFMPSRLLQGDDAIKFFPDSDKAALRTEGRFEDFISGGEDGASTVVLPRWSNPDTSKYSLWDYFGLPVGVTPDPLPIDAPRRMYNAVWNEYFRNENIEEKVSYTNNDILLANWRRDYFTSALPFQQRGTSPAIPTDLSGIGNVSFTYGNVNSIPVSLGSEGAASPNNLYGGSAPSSDRSGIYFRQSAAAGYYPLLFDSINGSSLVTGGSVNGDQFTGTGFDVSDLRWAFQIQKWMERNARGGVRYTEFLRAHFGVSPSDARLDRPVYIGGNSSPIIISEVLQTSQTTQGNDASPQGNMAGHGLGASSGYIGSYRVEEYGYIMGVAYIMPQRAIYTQGIPRELMREVREDFYWPEYANLSEQEVFQYELYAGTEESANKTVFGFQGRYNELRIGRDRAVGGFRDEWLSWTFARVFSAAPLLNQSFAQVDAAQLNRIFAVQTVGGKPARSFLINHANDVKAIRPIPYLAEPGLIDHH